MPMAASASINPRHIWGLRSDVKDNLHVIADTTIIYPAGHNIIIRNLESQPQQFIQPPLDSEGILGLTLAPNQRHVAVTERAERATVTIYDLQTLKRRKVLSSADISGKEITSVIFSQDSKLLAAQGGAPDWNLVLWQWEKSKLLASIRTSNPVGAPMTQLLFGPREAVDSPVHISAIGRGLFRTYRFQEGALKLLPCSLMKKPQPAFTAHAWITEGDEEKVLLGTENGDVLIVLNGDLRGNVSVEPDIALKAIVPTSKGFAAGCSSGSVSIFEREADSRLFRRVWQATVEGLTPGVTSMVLTPSEDALLLTTAGRQMLKRKLTGSPQGGDEPPFVPLAQLHHSAEVTGADTCLRRPIIATASLDRSVRVWNYLDKSCELVREFTEEAHCIALHPSGYNLLVGFSDKLRLFVVLVDTLKLLAEFPMKACSDCCFSNGGHHFAAASNNSIAVYNTCTCELLGTLRGHNGKVRSLAWSANDAHLVSCGTEGAVYRWKLRTFKRDRENVLKGCIYNCAVVSSEPEVLYACSADGKVCQLEDHESTGTHITATFESDTVLTQLCLPPGGRTLYAGTESGCIRCYRLPLTGDFQEYRCFSAAVLRLRMGSEDTLLFATSADGCIFMLEAKEWEPLKIPRRDQADKLPWADEVFISKADFDDKRQRMADLEGQVHDVKMQNEYNLRLKDAAMHDKVRELTERHAADMGQAEARNAALHQAMEHQRLQYEEKLEDAAEHQQAQLSALDDQFQTKLAAEAERYDELLRGKDALNERWDEQNKQLLLQHERLLEEVTADCNAKVEEAADMVDQAQLEKEEAESKAQEVRRLMEIFTDEEIEQLKASYETRLAAETETGLQLRGELGILRKKVGCFQGRIEELQAQLQHSRDLEAGLHQTIDGLEAGMTQGKKDAGAQAESAAEAAKALATAERRLDNTAAEKAELVQRIADLKQQLTPFEGRVQAAIAETKARERELCEVKAEKEKHYLLCEDLKLKTKASRREADVISIALRNATRATMRFQHDLEGIMPHILDPKQLRESVKRLYDTHCRSEPPADSVPEESPPPETAQDLERPRETFEQQAASLRSRIQSETSARQAEKKKLMQENILLIKEVREMQQQVASTQKAATMHASRKGRVA